MLDQYKYRYRVHSNFRLRDHVNNVVKLKIILKTNGWKWMKNQKIENKQHLKDT